MVILPTSTVCTCQLVLWEHTQFKEEEKWRAKVQRWNVVRYKYPAWESKMCHNSQSVHRPVLLLDIKFARRPGERERQMDWKGKTAERWRSVLVPTQGQSAPWQPFLKRDKPCHIFRISLFLPVFKVPLGPNVFTPVSFFFIYSPLSFHLFNVSPKLCQWLLINLTCSHNKTYNLSIQLNLAATVICHSLLLLCLGL